MKTRKGQISLTALCISAGVHLAALGGLAFVKISQPAGAASAAGAVSIASSPEPVAAPLITEKPRMESQPETHEPVVSSASSPVENKEVSSTPQTVYEHSDSDVDFFGSRSVSRSVCFVVDCSGSMYGRLGMIQRQLKDCIASLQDRQSFYLIFFMDGNILLESGDGTLKQATGQAKSEAFEMIDQVRLGGQTNASQALKRAMQLRDMNGRAVQLVYFMTDGFDLADNPAEPFYKTLMNARKKNAPHVTINTIGFWASEADRSRLRLIAEMTGGTYLNIE